MSENIILPLPENITIPKYMKGDAVVELSGHDLHAIGNFLMSTSGPEMLYRHNLSILSSVYKSLYDRVMKREGVLLNTSRLIKENEVLKAENAELKAQLLELGDI